MAITAAMVKELREITVRTLAKLVKMGFLVAVGKHEKLVHYASPKISTEVRNWYENK